MGIDLRAIRVRLDAEPIQQLLTSPNVFEDTVSRPPFTTLDRGEPLPALNRALIAAGVPGWDHPYPDRSYGAAIFVMDPAAWRAANGVPTPKTPPYQVIYGERALADHAESDQGFHWRGSSATFLRQAADRIDGLDLAALRREFSVTELADAGTYKVFEGNHEDELFARVTRNLAALGHYYRTTAQRDLDLIIERW